MKSTNGGEDVTKSPEERISALEEAVVSLKEGMSRVEKGFEKLEETFAVLMDKLDNRYPSKENVDLRFAQLHDDIHGENGVKTQMETLKKFMYKVTGAIALVGFVIGVLANSHKW
jgi:hypothetical protein